jgi:hypothetical protein
MISFYRDYRRSSFQYTSGMRRNILPDAGSLNDECIVKNADAGNYSSVAHVHHVNLFIV